MHDDDETRTLVQRRDELLAKALAQRQPALVVLAGPSVGKAYRLGPGATRLGRSYGQEITLDDEGVSRHHATIQIDPTGAALIQDARSTNGTRLNGELLSTAPQPLRDGDRVQLGTTVLLKFTRTDALEDEVQARLYESAVRDALTHCFNRRYFQERFSQEMSFARRHNSPLSLVVMDLDHFKRINDEHGHAAGDQVLRAVAARIQSNLRDEDLLARLGGEEFALLLRDTPLVEAVAVAERARRRIGGAPIHFEGRPIQTSASFGVACTSEPGVETTDHLFSQADQRMYQAKQAGRNRVQGA